jgi:hypothetical protein
MWEYSGRRDSTQLSVDELKENEFDERVCVLSSLAKKYEMPKVFGTEPFYKTRPRAEVLLLIRAY